MLSHLSWPVYGLYAGIFLVLAYAVIGLLYYRQEAKKFFKKQVKEKPGEPEAPELAGAVKPEPGMSSGNLDDLMRGTLPDCLEEIKWFFDQAAKDGASPEELPGLLAPLLEPYVHLFEEGFGNAIREQIRVECREQMGYELPKKNKRLAPYMGSGLVVLLVLFSVIARGQDGNSGIQQATTMVKGYFDTGCNLMYAIGAVVGIVGAIKVYQKWNAGEPDTGKVAAAWFGSCIFLVVVATVIKSFFGL